MTALPYRACPVVLAAPSGAGKTTIARALVDRWPEFVFSVSVTTRHARRGEREGVDYRFVSRPAFEAMIEGGELCEWAEVHGEFYGTPEANLLEAAGRGEHVVLDIDVQGARQIRERVPEAVLVFVFPPSAESLVARLTRRSTEDSGQMARRLRNAVTELDVAREFDYVVVNDELDGAVRQIRELVRAESHRPSRARDFEQDVRRVQEDIDRIVVARFAPGGSASGSSHGTGESVETSTGTTGERGGERT